MGSHKNVLYLAIDNPHCTQWPHINLFKRLIPSYPFLAQKWPRLPQLSSCSQLSTEWIYPLVQIFSPWFSALRHCPIGLTCNITLAAPSHFPILSIQILLYHSPKGQPTGSGSSLNSNNTDFSNSFFPHNLLHWTLLGECALSPRQNCKLLGD